MGFNRIFGYFVIIISFQLLAYLMAKSYLLFLIFGLAFCIESELLHPNRYLGGVGHWLIEMDKNNKIKLIKIYKDNEIIN